MANSIARLIKTSKEDSDAMMELLKKMEPLIKSYTRKMFFLESLDAEQELAMTIIEAVKKIKRCETDGECLTYIQNAVKYKFVSMAKENMVKEKNENPYLKNFDEKMYMEKYTDIETFYDLQMKTEHMDENQKDVLRYLMLGYSDTEIGKKLCLSRQYINRIKKKIY